jgi:hypothetical protein
MEEKKKSEAKVKYEVPMYKLVAIFGFALLIFLVAGFWMGNQVGYSSGLDNVDVTVPEYCTTVQRSGTITVTCTELEDYSAEELCSILSTSLQKQIKVVVIAN